MSLQERTVIVTGAGSGIGRATAELVASQGAQVVLAEIHEEHGCQVEESIRGQGGRATFIQTNVADESSVNRMVQKCLEVYGSLYGLVNNAGIEIEADILSTSPQEWDRILSVNLRGVFLCARSVLPHLRRSGRGSIVNIASVHANFGFEGCSAYDASKGGVVSLTRTIALENGPYQVRANSISPGYIDTAMWDAWLAARPDPARIDQETRQWHPLRRRGAPQDVARAVRFFLSDESEWITGANLVVDGGLSARFFGS
ncbi:MAG: SDR family NAD(P)-dependent oxidoreductase [Acidobacteriota bacterium]